MAEAQQAGAAVWYVRRGRQVRGPFTAAQIGKNVLLGRVRPDDEASIDRSSWRPVGEEPRLLPPEVREDAPPEALEAARRREDERTGRDRRRPDGPLPPPEERRAESDRREPQPEQVVRRQQRKARFLEQLRQRPERTRQAWAGIGVAVAGILVLSLIVGAPEPESVPDCTAPPAPQVNWSNCRMEALSAPRAELQGAEIRNARLREADLRAARLAGADLSYTELARADLSYADLAGAQLKGAILQGADLTYASLVGADLSYADLRGARLGGAELTDAVFADAIWVDGRVCPPGAVGGCPPAP